VLALRTPEAWEKQDIWRYLDSLPNCWYVKPMTFGYGKSGVPDILACLDGKFVSIEVKRHGKGATATQKRRMAEVAAAGGTAFWGTADKVIADLSSYLKPPRNDLAKQVATLGVDSLLPDWKP
jgi:hypothetical protein